MLQKIIHVNNSHILRISSFLHSQNLLESLLFFSQFRHCECSKDFNAGNCPFYSKSYRDYIYAEGLVPY